MACPVHSTPGDPQVEPMEWIGGSHKGTLVQDMAEATRSIEDKDALIEKMS